VAARRHLLLDHGGNGSIAPRDQYHPDRVCDRQRPASSGFVASLGRPGGNITGFTHVEAATGGKWLSLLKEIAPSIKRAAFMFNPETAPDGGKYFLASFEAAAGSLVFRSHQRIPKSA